MRRRKEKGQALILVVLVVGLVLMGALGLALDAGQLYGHRQMAQAAADAAAESAILSIYGGTWTPSSAFTCTNGTDSRTPCAYARLNGFGLASSPASETVVVNFPTSIPGGDTLSPDFTPAAVHVSITRPVRTTLLRWLGAAQTKSIRASATAAILKKQGPIPIIVLHPTLPASFSLQGGGSSSTNLQVCGGPQKSVQVNSNHAAAVSVGGSQTVDLSKGGPLDSAGNCTTGTGTDFGVFGGPRSTPPILPSWMTPSGSTEHYFSGDPPIPDPLFNVSPPTRPSTAGTATNIAAGTGDCPAYAGMNGSSGCTVFTPGYFPTGIQVKQKVAIFQPGIYYMDAAPGTGSFKGVGFGTGPNAGMIMCTHCTADTSGCCGNNGMMVYLTPSAGVFSVTSGSGLPVSLLGASPSSVYKGMIFYADRNSPAATGSSSHLLQAGADLRVQGTIYLTNCWKSVTGCATTMTATHYQNLRLRGSPGSQTNVVGEIIVSTLDIGGGGAIRMHLNPSANYSVNQMALVN